MPIAAVAVDTSVIAVDTSVAALDTSVADVDTSVADIDTSVADIDTKGAAVVTLRAALIMQVGRADSGTRELIGACTASGQAATSSRVYGDILGLPRSARTLAETHHAFANSSIRGTPVPSCVM